MPECQVLIAPTLYLRLVGHPLCGWMVQIDFSSVRLFGDRLMLVRIRSPLIKSVSDGRMPMMRAIVLEGGTLSFPEEDFPFET